MAVIAGGSVVYASFLGREGSESGQSVVLDQGNAPGSAPGTAWVAVRNAGTVGPPTVKGGPPSTNPPSLCGGPNDLTALFQFDAQFRPTHWSCVNYTATALVAGAGGRLLLAGLASSGDFFATVPPPIPPMTTPELPISSTAVFNGGTVDAVFQLYSTATPASNLESFFPYAQGGTLGPALAGDFDGLGGANDIFVSGPDMARLSGLLNVSPSGPSTSPGSTISTPLSSFPLIATGATVFKDAVTRRTNNIAFVGVPSNSGLSGAGQILVGINNGQGIFGGFQPLVAPPAASNLSHGDFNNDGFDDLAFLDFNTNSAGVLLNDGRNNFKSASFRPTSGAVSIASAVADFDDDGTLDLAVLNQGLPVSGGKFSQGGIALLRGAGDGTLQAPFQLQTAELGLSMAGGLSDIEANGTRRLVDFNNDGYADLAIASARNSTIPGLLNPTVAVYLNQPSNPGTFVAATPADIGGSPSAALGDSFLFSAPQLQFGNNQIGNNSAGSTNAATTVSATQAMPMVAADFDRDGNWDLAVVNPATNTLSIFKGDGRGGLTPAGTYLVGHTPVSVAVADLNGDKMPDLVVSNKDSRSVQVFLNRNPPPAIENPEISAAGVANAASFQGGAVSPGEIVTLFGSGMGPVALTGLQLDATGKVAVQVAGTRVLFDGTPAPIVYTSAGQLSVVVPYAVAGKAHTLIQVEYQGRRSNPVARPVALFRPALFTANSSGTGQAAILNQDASVNSASNPAAKGSVIVIYATGEGQTTPAGVDGAVAGAILPKPPFPVRVKIGEADAAVVYYGAAPGLVSGVLQVNAVVPAGAPSGSAVPVTIILGAVSSPAGVTLAVK